MAQAENVTVVYTAQVGALGNRGGEDLEAGSLVRFGVFDATPEELEGHAEDLDFLLDRFWELSSTQVGRFDGFDFEIDGVFGQSVTFDPEEEIAPGFAEGLVGARAYIWGFDAPTVEAAESHGLFSHVGWVIPEIATATFELDQVAAGAPGDVYIGEFSPGASEVTDGGNLHQLVPVPEPGGVALVFMAVSLGLFGRRRSE